MSPFFLITSKPFPCAGSPVRRTSSMISLNLFEFSESVYFRLFIPTSSSLEYPRISQMDLLKKVRFPARSVSKNPSLIFSIMVLYFSSCCLIALSASLRRLTLYCTWEPKITNMHKTRTRVKVSNMSSPRT